MTTPLPEPTQTEFIAAWMQDELARMSCDAQYSALRSANPRDTYSAYYRNLALACQDLAADQWRRTRAYIDRECM